MKKIIFADKEMRENSERVLIYLKGSVVYLMYKGVEHNLNKIIKSLNSMKVSKKKK